MPAIDIMTLLTVILLLQVITCAMVILLLFRFSRVHKYKVGPVLKLKGE
ncbi:MAG: hypothetical protein J7J87_01770 [Candidatus Diapherotrites archaeon]|nr:hypothetical protein [Candidatus Diapherotrites archaeon]